MSDVVTTINGTAPTGYGETPTQPRPFKAASTIEITIKRNHHQIEIDMDRLTWADGKMIRKFQRQIEAGELTEDRAVELMDTIIEKVTGRHPDALPMEVVNKVVSVLFAEDADAAAAEGN